MGLLLSSNHIFVILALVAFILVILCFYFGRKSPYLFDTVDEWQEWINQASYKELVVKRLALVADSHKNPPVYQKIVQLIDRALLVEKKVPLDTDNALIVDDINDFVEQVMNTQIHAAFSGFCCLPYNLPKIVVPKISLDYKADEALHFAKFNHRQLLNAADVGRLKKLAGNVARTFRCVDIDFDEKAMFWGLAESDDLSLSEEDLLIAYALYSGHDCSNVKLDEKRALICKI